MNELVHSLYQSLGLALDQIDQEPHGTPSDGITLITGTHSIQIDTGKPPTKVFVNLDEGNHQVCGGADMSSVSVQTTPTGFTMFVVVKSDCAVVSWVIL